MQRTKALKRIAANLLVLFLLPILAMGSNLLFAKACCGDGEFNTHYERFNFLSGLFRFHSAQLSFSILMFGSFLAIFLIVFLLASAIRADKKYFQNVLVSFVQLLPIFVALHLFYWFEITGRNIFWVNYVLGFLVFPVIWLGVLRLTRGMQLAANKHAIIGLPLKVLAFIYLALMLDQIFFLGIFVLCPLACLLGIWVIFKERKALFN